MITPQIKGIYLKLGTFENVYHRTRRPPGRRQKSGRTKERAENVIRDIRRLGCQGAGASLGDGGQN